MLHSNAKFGSYINRHWFSPCFQEYDALFYETSAKTGSYVAEAMVGMARYVSAYFWVCDVNRCNFIVVCCICKKQTNNNTCSGHAVNMRNCLLI